VSVYKLIKKPRKNRKLIERRQWIRAWLHELHMDNNYKFNKSRVYLI
jgi:hypothetical protein